MESPSFTAGSLCMAYELHAQHRPECPLPISAGLFPAHQAAKPPGICRQHKLLPSLPAEVKTSSQPIIFSASPITLNLLMSSLFGGHWLHRVFNCLSERSVCLAFGFLFVFFFNVLCWFLWVFSRQQFFSSYFQLQHGFCLSAFGRNWL